MIPKAIYRELGRGLGEGLPAPIQVDVRRGNSYTSSEQAVRHLLCGDCEQLLSRRGESIVLPDLRRRDGFGLRDRRLVGINSFRPYHPFHDDAPDRGAWTHFSLSVVWRAAVADWGRYSAATGELGPFEDSFRNWLLGTGPFPLSTAIEIVVDTDAKSPAVGWIDVGTDSQFGLEKVFRFVVPGVFVRVHVGGYGNFLAREVYGQHLLPVMFRKASFKKIGLTDFVQKLLGGTTSRGSFAGTRAR